MHNRRTILYNDFLKFVGGTAREDVELEYTLEEAKIVDNIRAKVPAGPVQACAAIEAQRKNPELLIRVARATCGKVTPTDIKTFHNEIVLIVEELQ